MKKLMMGLIGMLMLCMMGIAQANTYSFHSDAAESNSAQKRCFYHGDPLPDTRRECFFNGDVDYPWAAPAGVEEKKVVVTTTDFKWWEGLQILLGMGDE